MPNRIFKCPKCGTPNSRFQDIKDPINKNHKCDSKDCSYEGHMEIDYSKSSIAFNIPRDWQEGKTAQEISDYLVPDHNGVYKDPY